MDVVVAFKLHVQSVSPDACALIYSSQLQKWNLKVGEQLYKSLAYVEMWFANDFAVLLRDVVL